MKWPFDQPRNCAAVFSKSVLDRSRPILHVSHDEDDHGWRFLDGVSEELDDSALVASEGAMTLIGVAAYVAAGVGWYFLIWP